MRIRPYDAAADAQPWDALCDRSFCTSFLPSRRFLSYHGERFQDASLVVEDDGGEWLGVFPAALDPGDPTCVVSHPGITFGGVVHAGRLRGDAMLDALTQIGAHYAASGCARLRYKAVPHIYHRMPAADDSYALFRLGAHRYRCDLSCAIDLAQRGEVSRRRQRRLKKAAGAGVELESGARLSDEIWTVLRDNLRRRHAVEPTHDEREIAELAARFPDGVQFRGARLDGRIEAGVVIFACERVHHAQYLACSERGRAVGALDCLMEEAITCAARVGVRWFDFGISTEADGRELNEGLYTFKREFGGGGVVHEFFELEVR